MEPDRRKSNNLQGIPRTEGHGTVSGKVTSRSLGSFLPVVHLGSYVGVVEGNFCRKGHIILEFIINI